MKRIVSKRHDFVVDALFYFKPVQRFKYPGDMFDVSGSSYCASKEVLQQLKTRYLIFAVSLGRVSCNSLI